MIALAFATSKELCAALPGAPDMDSGVTRASVAGRDVLVVVTGIGPINAALSLGRLVAEHQPRGVLNLGLAGSFDLKALPLGSTALVNLEIWPEYGLRTRDGVDAQALGFPLAALSNQEPTWDRLALTPQTSAQAMGLTLPVSWPEVASLSVAGVTAEPSLADTLVARYQATLENMEGFALALGCARLGLPFVEVRTVSNKVGSRAREDWDIPLAFDALGNAAQGLLGGAP